MHALPRTKKNHFSSTQWCYLTMLKAALAYTPGGSREAVATRCAPITSASAAP
jgi:hypothetical protein